MYGVKGTSSETVWKKNYVFISAQLEDLYEQECLRAYSIVVGSLGDAVLSKINVVMRDDGSGAVDDDKSTTVLMGDARKLWKVLFGLYEKKTTVAVFISWDKFSTDYLKPGEKVISYVSRLKEIRDRLLAQGDSLSETQLVFKFLNTLTPEYSTVATVLKMKENITFEEAVQKITDYEESQVYKQSKESMTERKESHQDTANYVKGKQGGGRYNKGKFNPKKFRQGGHQHGSFKRHDQQGGDYRPHADHEDKKEHQPRYDSSRGNQGRRHQDNNGRGPTCFVCNRVGHIAAQCKFNKNRPTQVRSQVPRYGRAMFTDGGDYLDSDDDRGDHRSYCTRVINDDHEVSYAARQVHDDADGQAIVMNLDSGSNGHHVGDDGKDLLGQVEVLTRPATVLTASDEVLTSKLKGDVAGVDEHGNKMIVKGVKYTPGFKVNLMSVSQWCTQGTDNCQRKMVFDKSGVTAYQDDAVMFKGVVRDGLYEVVIRKDKQWKSYATKDDKKWTAYKELHEKLGHMGKKVIDEMVKCSAVDGIDKYEIPSLRELQDGKELCEGCVFGKGHRNKFSKTSSRAKVHGVMGRLFADLSGPINADENLRIHQQLGSKRYVSVIVDDKSGFISVKTLRHKNEAATHLKEFSLLGENKTGKRVQYIHTDQGSEYVNAELKQFATMKGIQLENTVAYTPQQNGKVERMNRTIFNAARAMLLHAGLDYAFWPLAVEAAVYLLNYRVTGNHGETAHELFHGSRPSIKRLQVFGADCYVIIPERYRDKLEPRARKCIFVGYSPTHDGAWKCYDVGTGKILITRDVLFENKFDNGKEENLRVKLTRRNNVSINYTENSTNDDDEVKYLREEEEKEQNKNKGSENETKYSEYQSIEIDQPVIEMKNKNQQQQQEYKRSEQAVHNQMNNNRKIQQPQIINTSIRRAQQQQLQQPAAIINNKTRLALLKIGDHMQASDKERQERERLAQLNRQGNLNDELPATRSGRAIKPPERLTVGMKNKSNTDSTSNNNNNEERKNERVNLAYTSDVPTTYQDAMKRNDSDEWRKASDEEMKNMIDNDVYELVDRKEAMKNGKNVLKSRWVYTIKVNKNGDIERYKGRFVACGYSQEAGVDFDETFAPVGRYKTLRIVLCLVAEMDYELKQMDVVSAFLNAKLKEELFIEQPDGYADDKDGKVWKLKKAIYGIKQAPYEWNKEINSQLTSIGFTRLKTDTCLYTKISKSGKVIVLFVFVDDIVIAYHRTDKDEWMDYRSIITNRYKVKDIGDLQWVLGMNVTRDRKNREITLDQQQYIKKKLEQFKLTNVKPSKIPGDKSLKLVTQAEEGDEVEPLDNKSPTYREIVGSLLYASIGTRPDIAHAVHEISKFNNNPTSQHYKAALRVLKYLSGTNSSHILTYRASGNSLNKFVIDGKTIFAPVLHVTVFCDADWAGDHADRKSTTGYLVRINNNTVSWSAKKQNTTSLSSAEAEYMAIASAAQETIWMRQFLTELFHLNLDINNIYSCTILTDNTSAAQIAKHDVSHDRTKHIDIRYHFIRDYLQEGWYDLQWVSTDHQLADIFTKVLPINRFETLVKSILAPSHTQV